ncbi:DNA double-strand break repair nuclease NurA [Candidatus Bathyarchaeota archaeon]|nr:DNA double-strand break repair nuclease NurA [Candidatus Bathyarchaeota archaeon]
MIEQIQYTATPKYNFSQIINNIGLSRKFIELSLNSMNEIKERFFQPWIEFNGQSIERSGEQEDTVEVYSRDAFSIISPLEPIPDNTPIVAIDTSSIKVGETESGVICAVRGAVVWNERRQYRCLRIGPFPFHITEDNKREILRVLGQYSPIAYSSNASFLIEVQSRLCNALERWIQMMVSRSASNSIILWDGTLSCRPQNDCVSLLLRILEDARRNSNAVISLSKASTVKFLGRRITDLLMKQREPCLLEIDEHMLSISSKSLRLLGKIYVAKLSEKGYAFRVDVDRGLSRDVHMMALRRLMGNDSVFQGYPEALRLAHIFSTFTASDVIGIQRFISRKYGLKVVTWPSIRKALFGPFGTGGAGD